MKWVNDQIVIKNKSEYKIGELSCIYFLFFKDELIYIGETKNIYRRQSVTESCEYTHVRYIKCVSEKRKHYEKRLINYFRPPLNRMFNPNPKKSKYILPTRNPGWFYSMREYDAMKSFGAIFYTKEKFEYELQVAKLKFDYDMKTDDLKNTIFDKRFWLD